MTEALALTIILFAIVYLFTLSATSFFAPASATRFLNGFASSARAHYMEMLTRLIAGWAFITYASNMYFSEAFRLFGWVLVASTIVLSLFPWRWHYLLSQKLVPPLIRRVWLFGVVSFALGGVILFAVSYPIFA